MKTKICFSIYTLVCFFVTISQAEIKITINDVQGLIDNGFQCRESAGENGEVTECVIESEPSATQLPSYFPDSYRNLNGNSLMYLASRNASSSGLFSLVSSKLPVHSGTYVMLIMEYYAETSMTVGYMIYLADAGIGFFDASSGTEWKTDFSKSVLKANFNTNEVTYLLSNDQISRFSVFRKLEIIIDPEPQIKIKITNLFDFANSGAICPNCELGSVDSPQDLPSYFPEGFRQLPSNTNNSIMFIDFQNTAMPTLIMADLSKASNLSCTGYVDLSPEFYNERIGSFGWGKTYNSWSPYAVSAPSTWSVNDSSFFHLDYYLMQGNRLVGFYSYNDGFNKMSVFRKLEANIYYYPQPEVNCRSREIVSLNDGQHPFANLINTLQARALAELQKN